MEKGYISVYTGNGKGKTTAAFGLAVRALLSGKKVFIGQFVKDIEYKETRLAKHFDNVEIKQLGKGCFISNVPTDQDIEAARDGLEKCSKKMSSGEYDLVILDEITIALYFNLLDLKELVDALKNKAYSTEVVLTGRYASEELIDIADLVTEMVEIKHYFSQGVLSRDGYDC